MKRVVCWRRKRKPYIVEYSTHVDMHMTWLVIALLCIMALMYAISLILTGG